ncbi:hypothetical protein X975_12640, partial [Stegodyphus mimosarum]
MFSCLNVGASPFELILSNCKSVNWSERPLKPFIVDVAISQFSFPSFILVICLFTVAKPPNPLCEGASQELFFHILVKPEFHDSYVIRFIFIFLLENSPV